MLRVNILLSAGQRTWLGYHLAQDTVRHSTVRPGEIQNTLKGRGQTHKIHSVFLVSFWQGPRDKLLPPLLILLRKLWKITSREWVLIEEKTVHRRRATFILRNGTVDSDRQTGITTQRAWSTPPATPETGVHNNLRRCHWKAHKQQMRWSVFLSILWQTAFTDGYSLYKLKSPFHTLVSFPDKEDTCKEWMVLFAATAHSK